MLRKSLNAVASAKGKKQSLLIKIRNCTKPISHGSSFDFLIVLENIGASAEFYYLPSC